MRIYISGPISGTDVKETRMKFRREEMFLKAMRHEVVNPMHMGDWGLSWKVYLAIAKVILSSGEVDAMYMMPGWSWSKGCRLEVKWAIEQDIPIYYGGQIECPFGNEVVTWMQKNI
jgi:hypothetical protein